MHGRDAAQVQGPCCQQDGHDVVMPGIAIDDGGGRHGGMVRGQREVLRVARVRCAGMRDRFNAFVERHEIAWELTMAVLAIVYVIVGFQVDDQGRRRSSSRSRR